MKSLSKLCRICKAIYAAIGLCLKAAHRMIWLGARIVGDAMGRKRLDIGARAAYISLHVSSPRIALARATAKPNASKQTGGLNRHPERVRAPWFQGGGFFDARDLVQVKYEMLRQVTHRGRREEPKRLRSSAYPVQLFIRPKPTLRARG